VFGSDSAITDSYPPLRLQGRPHTCEGNAQAHCSCHCMSRNCMHTAHASQLITWTTVPQHVSTGTAACSRTVRAVERRRKSMAHEHDQHKIQEARPAKGPSADSTTVETMWLRRRQHRDVTFRAVFDTQRPVSSIGNTSRCHSSVGSPAHSESPT
jgi:hypothetical protein